MRSGAHRRQTGIGALPAGEEISHRVFAHRQPRRGETAFQECTGSEVFRAEQDAGDGRRLDFGKPGQLLQLATQPRCPLELAAVSWVCLEWVAVDILVI